MNVCVCVCVCVWCGACLSGFEARIRYPASAALTTLEGGGGGGEEGREKGILQSDPTVASGLYRLHQTSHFRTQINNSIPHTPHYHSEEIGEAQYLKE